MEWKKIDRSENADGTTITYKAECWPIIIQSRKRKIPHANGSGYWWHTTYVVMANGHEIATKQRLADAKAIAERGGK